jgi:lipopolysaccharide biosynthesis glycosyltransferase
VFLDADMVLRRNIDACFCLPEGFYACPDCTSGRTNKEERNGCQFFGFCKGVAPNYFNTGFFVFQPSRAVCRQFEKSLGGSWKEQGDFAEQDFLNRFYKDWQPLPYTLNAQKCIKQHHPELWHLPDICNIHFVDEKPWNQPRHHACHEPWRDEVDYWWDVYENKLCKAETGLGIGQECVDSCCGTWYTQAMSA